MKKNHLSTGQHLIIDAAHVRNDAFASRHEIVRFFSRLIDAMEMKPLGEMTIGRVEEPGNRGYTALQMISTSHISFHADELGRGFYLDVFSCKKFDEQKVIALVQETFAPCVIYKNNFDRDIRYRPQDIKQKATRWQAMPVVDSEVEARLAEWTAAFHSALLGANQ